MVSIWLIFNIISILNCQFSIHSLSGGDGEGLAGEFADVADFLLEAVVLDVLIGEQHAKAVLAESFLRNASLQKQPLEIRGLVAILLDLHNHQLRHIGFATREHIAETDAAVDGDALGFGLVDQCDALKTVL